MDFIYLKSQVLAEPIAQTIFQETGYSVSPLHFLYMFYSQIVLEEMFEIPRFKAKQKQCDFPCHFVPLF